MELDEAIKRLENFCNEVKEVKERECEAKYDIVAIETVLKQLKEKDDDLYAANQIVNEQIDVIREQEKENTDLKELYIRTAKHQEKIGHKELAEYMLAQIQAIPTFTTWEEYTTWVSKDKIRELKEFYIKDCKNKNITLVTLENLVKNINILLEE